MARPPNPFDLDDAVRRYEAGEGVYQLAPELHVKPSRLKRLLKEAGVHIRSRSEARQMEWKLIDASGRREEEVALRLSVSHARRVGMKFPMKWRINMAKARAGSTWGPSRPYHEREIVGELDARGVAVSYQHPIGPYLVDFALNERAVAVEIQRANWTLNVVPRRTLHKERLEYILNDGWSLLVVYCPPLRRRNRTIVVERFDRVAVADKILALLDKPGVFPPGGGQYGVIDGHAQPAPIVRLDLDGWPVIPGL